MKKYFLICLSLPVFFIVIAGCKRTGNISGRILLENGVPLSGVTVVLTDQELTTEATAQTDSDGFYAFVQINRGIYTVSPALDGYIFSPEIQDVELKMLDLRDIDFTAIRDFCGWSTGGECSTEDDCKTGGCSEQVCQSIDEGPVYTDCEWQECYDNEKYELTCQCVEGKCMWAKQ